MSRSIQISAGTGPVEVRTFVALLAKAVQARCASCGVAISAVTYRGDPKAPFSVALVVEEDLGACLIGWLGTHQLIAVSGSRGPRSRKRWFAGVSVSDNVDTMIEVVRASDVDFRSMRAGGPGGQHVNTTSSAVRAHHRPSGVTVRVAKERCQHANRRLALVRIGEVLGRRNRQRAASAKAERRRTHTRLVRGNAVMDWKIGCRGQLLPNGG